MMRISKKNGSRILLAVGMVMLFAAAAVAAPMSATVMSAKGNVEYKVKGASGWNAVKTGMVLSEGASVRCAADGEAILRWSTGNVIKVFSLSAVTLELMEKDKSGKETSMVAMNGGKVLAQVNKMAADSKFEMRTPSAVAGVRGSDLFGDMSLNKNGNFSCLTGAGYVIGGGETQELPAGTTSSVSDDGTPSTPVATSQELTTSLQSSIKEVDDAASAPAPPAVEETQEAEQTEEAAASAAEAVNNTVNDTVTNTTIQDQILNPGVGCCDHNTEMNWGAESQP